MKFAIPLVNGKLTLHFGHCQQFALIEVEGDQIIDKQLVVPPPHEPGVLPQWLHSQGVNFVIAGGMGNRALSLFAGNDIKVITGAPPEEPEALIESYLQKTLKTGENLCDH
jgi:predicted Fe-Mo cluster-binding NifX family protein